MNIFKFVPDKYTLGARVLPVLFTILPAVILYFGLFGKLDLKLVSDIGIVGIVLAVACHAVRDKGTALQKRLMKKWKHFPSVTLLRWRDASLSEPQKEAIREAVRQGVSGFTWPTRRQESANPDLADQAYERVSDWLKGRTRDRDRFYLLHEENIRYGFHRNALALKNHAQILAAFCLLVVVFKVCPYLFPTFNPEQVPTRLLVVGGALCTYLWMFDALVCHRILKNAARGYARELLASASHL